jgi:pSer/pThr/pTyr-binding forkhead associated (FHA) protein
MQVCGNCGHRNRPGVVFCDNCGTSLIGDSPLNTKQYKQDQAAEANAALDNAVHSAGSETFGKGTILRIEIGDSEPVLLKPKAETVFGRRDAATGSMPDVDLTPFAGYRMGVSRKHAIIKQSDEQDRLDLVDLGSSNGTFLNGARLNANKPYKLRDGDEMRLGQMIIHIYFQHNLGEQPPRPQSAQVGGINLTPPDSNDNGLSGEDGGKTNPVSPPDSPKTS